MSAASAGHPAEPVAARPADVSVAPGDVPWVQHALAAAGIPVVPLGETTRGLIWMGFHDPASLAAALRAAPNLEWVQLPSAGIDDFARAGLLDPRITWTSAKGAYSRPVAEHALTLALALLRHIPERARATEWGEPKGTSLYNLRVTIVGAGGIARELLRLLAPFETTITVVRRQADPVPGAARTVGADRLHEALQDADVVFLAAALTPTTAALIGGPELALLAETAILVNIARGGLVDLDALTSAMSAGALAGAALDVTNPEPLPATHPLWSEPRALITPHSADTWEMIQPLLLSRITTNVDRFQRGDSLHGVVDLTHGY